MIAKEKESSKLIAEYKFIVEFVGWKQALGHDKGVYATPHVIWKLKDASAFSQTYHDKEWCAEKEHTLDEMLFNSSWDWLMPVAKRIRNLWFTNANVDKDIYAGILWAEIFGCLGEVDIDKAYQAVVQFIEWYKQNKEA